MEEQSHPWATAGGLLALVVWSTTAALVRSLTESLGLLTGAALSMGLGGLVGGAVAWSGGMSPAAMLRLPRRYLAGCGALFIVYMACYYAAIGGAPNRSTMLAVNLLNYLWPTLTVALSVPLLGRRARWTMLPGCAVAFGGTALATLGAGSFTWSGLSTNGGAVVPLALGAAAGVTWALYSNLVKRWGGAGGAVPIFLLASAAAVGALRLFVDEETVWTPRAGAELAFIAVAQCALAYALWDSGLRRGDHLLLSLCSYLVPVGSTVVACLYLWIAPSAHLVAGCVLVTVGALICRGSIADGPDAGAGGPARPVEG